MVHAHNQISVPTLTQLYYTMVANKNNKRTAEEDEVPNKIADRGQETARTTAKEDDMGEFEDRWEDEIEEEVVDKDMMEEDGEGDGDGE